MIEYQYLDTDDEYEVFEFLDDLRESGVTNMFGAGDYIRVEFGVSRAEAGKLLTKWTQSFAG